MQGQQLCTLRHRDYCVLLGTETKQLLAGKKREKQVPVHLEGTCHMIPL